MIINDRKDFDALPQDQQDQFKDKLGAGIYGWAWEDGEWVETTNTASINQFGFTLADFPDAPVPHKPDYNQDEKELEQARQGATLTRMAFMLALEDAGLYDQVEAAVNSGQLEKRSKIMWDNASQFERMHPDLVAIATALGYTDQQMDNIFGINI